MTELFPLPPFFVTRELSMDREAHAETHSPPLQGDTSFPRIGATLAMSTA